MYIAKVASFFILFDWSVLAESPMAGWWRDRQRCWNSVYSTSDSAKTVVESEDRSWCQANEVGSFSGATKHDEYEDEDDDGDHKWKKKKTTAVAVALVTLNSLLFLWSDGALSRSTFQITLPTQRDWERCTSTEACIWTWTSSF